MNAGEASMRVYRRDALAKIPYVHNYLPMSSAASISGMHVTANLPSGWCQNLSWSAQDDRILREEILHRHAAVEDSEYLPLPIA